MDTKQFLDRISRRQFLGSSAKNAAGVAAGMVAVSSAGANVPGNDSEPVRLGLIGLRGHGERLGLEFLRHTNSVIASVCDVDESVLSRVARTLGEHQGVYPQRESDFRRVMDDSRVDAVVIATPDHWHAHMTTLACAAGKDVYLEPPIAHTIEEIQAVQDAAKSSKRIVQVGLQQRSGEHFRSAVDFVRGGQLGDVWMAKAWTVHRRKSLGRHRPTEPPESVDFGLWRGPADTDEFYANRFHQNWRWFWDYGSGELGNLGVHLLDVARWGLGLDVPESIVAVGGQHAFDDDRQTPDTLHVSYRYPNAGRTIEWEHRLWTNHGIEGRNAAVAFYGEHGTLIVDRGGWKVYGVKDAPTAAATDCLTPHLRNFIDCVRTRQQPTASLVETTASSTMVHLGNIAYRVGPELNFDAAAMNFGSNDAANALLARQYHADWPLSIT